jgi:hypothetical protein
LDTLIPTTADLGGDAFVIARAEAVRPAVAAAADEIESKRRLPPRLLDELHGQKLFRLLMPKTNGGIETDPITFFHVIETIARADASTAWCLSQAGGCAMTAAYLDLPVAQEIFGGPNAVVAWGPGPKARAIECEVDGVRGYKVTGEWAFASGGRHATWLGAHCPIFTADGAHRPFHSARPRLHARLCASGAGAPRAGAALPHVRDDLLRDRLRRRGAGYLPRRTRRLRRDGQDQDPARRQESDPR